MSFTFKILPAVVLANVLSPLAARAHDAAVAPQTLRPSSTTPGSVATDQTTEVDGASGVNSCSAPFGGE
jgi:hypothetical protein